jgi:hypothetical protein
MPDQEPRDAGAYVGRQPELAEETIPGGVTDKDERVAGWASRSSGPGERAADGPDQPPAGHRQGDAANEDRLREAGENR